VRTRIVTKIKHWSTNSKCLQTNTYRHTSIARLLAESPPSVSNSARVVSLRGQDQQEQTFRPQRSLNIFIRWLLLSMECNSRSPPYFDPCLHRCLPSPSATSSVISCVKAYLGFVSRLTYKTVRRRNDELYMAGVSRAEAVTYITLFG
jgi:hypothetical protein